MSERHNVTSFDFGSLQRIMSPEMKDDLPKEKGRKEKDRKTERERERHAENIGRTLCMEAFLGLFLNANVKDEMK